MEKDESPSGFPGEIKYFLKIPKEIIFATTLTEHRLSALIYLFFNRTMENNVHYSPAYMIQWCGYKANWRRGTDTNIYTKFRDCMQWFSDNGYICGFDKMKYAGNTFQSSAINKEKMFIERDFGVLYDFEIKRIMEYTPTYRPLNRSLLLLLLSYIRAYTWIRKTVLTGYSDKSKKEKPEIFYSQFEAMEKFIGVKSRLVSKATDVLEELELIKTLRLPNYQDQNKKWHTGEIIYVSPYKYVSFRGKIIYDETYEYRQELKYGAAFLREGKYSNKQFDQK